MKEDIYPRFDDEEAECERSDGIARLRVNSGKRTKYLTVRSERKESTIEQVGNPVRSRNTNHLSNSPWRRRRGVGFRGQLVEAASHAMPILTIQS